MRNGGLGYVWFRYIWGKKKGKENRKENVVGKNTIFFLSFVFSGNQTQLKVILISEETKED